MKRSHIAAIIFVSFLPACAGGGGSSAPGPLPQTAAANPTSSSAVEPQSQALSGAQSAMSGANDLLYIGNPGNNSITVYPHAASGNTAPLYVIAGSRTGLSSPGQLSGDAAGNLYVANGSVDSSSASPAILVFAHGANGNVAPIRRLAGSLTGLHQISAMTVDKTTGKVFVVDDAAGEGNPAFLLRFPPNPSGNEAPFARGNVGDWANQITSDSTGQNIIKAHIPSCCSVVNAGVDTYQKQFANGANPVFVRSLLSMFADGIADDPTTKTYLLTNGLGLYRLAETTTGFGPADDPPDPQNLMPSPVSIVTSETCGGQIAVPSGPTPYTYVVHDCVGDRYPAVNVYANNASGNAIPVRVLSGPATKMNKPYGIYEGL